MHMTWNGHFVGLWLFLIGEGVTRLGETSYSYEPTKCPFHVYREDAGELNYLIIVLLKLCSARYRLICVYVCFAYPQFAY